MKKVSILIIAFCTLLMYYACSRNESNRVPEVVSYNFHIRPILSDKCFKCHGPDANKREAGLRLDKPENAYAPLKETKGAFAIIPGKPEQSEMFRRISSEDSSYQMPTPDSHLGVLSEHEIALVKKWILQGARYERHWAFQKPVRQKIPEVSDKRWVKNPIDNFILNKQEERGLQHSEESEPEYLLKRVCLDLTGLPPTVEMMDAFIADKTPGAYERVVDQLIASPQYGEKMAIHWLDLARYSDSYGYQDDNIRTQWAWRDWVIHAFNTNLSYDKFLTWQIAGDMLPDATREQMLATGFFRNHKYTEEGGIIPEEYRIEYNLDKTKTFSKGILGLTVECAQCHDHKYDPVSQKEYYQLFAFFNNTKEAGFEGIVFDSKPAKTPFMEISKKDISSTMSFINHQDTGKIMVSVMGELDTIRKTFVLNRGVYDQPTYEVKPAALNAVMPYDSVTLPRNRLGLAAWTTSKNNPLTARVFVNQVWQEFFGRGIVKTSGDFGMQGELPSNPELLDYLAVDFMNSNWDIKHLVKQIVMSATYRQSAMVTEESKSKDPENIYLSRAPRNRLNAEFIRDLVLSSSGLLVKTIGGPSVKPYQPKGLWEKASSGRGELAKYKQDTADKLYRRGMYTFIKLTVPPPSMVMFDASNRDQCEVKRLQTNTPLQALIMMNDPTVLEASRVLAQKLIASGGDSKSQILNAFQRIICRKPNSEEEKILANYYIVQLEQFRSGKLDALKTLNVGSYPLNKTVGRNESAALMKVICAIYNIEEAIVKT
ncbi:MAG TPA: PSD1 and planctomycete cytochrome C domain-containing protein [Flavitalea sp.]|nr:PSD1 and planctomycete cytochrome C domain-containing protein [Flavitalea sp.]